MIFKKLVRELYGIRADSITSPSKLHEADQTSFLFIPIDRFGVESQYSSAEPWLIFTTLITTILYDSEDKPETLED